MDALEAKVRAFVEDARNRGGATVELPSFRALMEHLGLLREPPTPLPMDPATGKVDEAKVAEEKAARAAASKRLRPPA